MKNTFIISQSLSMTNGSTVDFVGETPATDVIIKFDPLHIAAQSSPVVVELYEAPTTTGGTALTPISPNRTATSTPTVVAKSAPSVSAVGTLLYTMMASGDKHSGGSGDMFDSFVLKSGTKYLYRIKNVSGSASLVTVVLSWDEVY